MTLYRTYRPQLFADFVNQNPIKQIIQNQITTQTVPHAYLFAGPRGVGKTTMARLIAKALNCEKRDENDCEPCNACTSCTEITKGISLDIVEQDAASNRGIDEIRSLKDTVRFASARRYKIFIIDEVHMLTLPAFNALLKTLEEPPERTIFILATTEVYKLPETIISRCQRFDFKKIHCDEICAYLRRVVAKEGIRVAEDIVKTIALRSDGGLRDALSMLGTIVAIGVHGKDREITWEEAQSVVPRSDLERVKQLISYLEDRNAKDAFALVHTLMHEGVDIEQCMLDTVDALRTRMIEALETSTTSHRFRGMIDIFLKRLTDAKNVSFLPQLPLELAILEICEQGQAENSPKSGASKDTTPHRSTLQKQDDPQRQEVMNPNVPAQNKTTTAHQPISSQEHPVRDENAPALGTLSLTLDSIQNHWNDFLHQVKLLNHSLPVALSACKPVAIEGETLLVGCAFKIHSQAINNEKNRSQLEHILENLLHRKLRIRGVVQEGVSVPLQNNSPKESTTSVEEVFGEGV